MTSTWTRVVDQGRRRTDSLAEQRDRRGRALTVANDLEHREGRAQQGIEGGTRLDHHELSGRGGRGDGRRRERHDVVRG